MEKYSFPQKVVLSICLLGIFIVTILKAIRLPNGFAKIHWLTSYDYGFVKRGLMGSIAKPLILMNGKSGAEQIINVIGIVLFVLLCAVLLWLSMRIVVNSSFNRSSIILILIFIASPYVVMSAHLVGYYDGLVIMISFAACLAVLKNHNIYAAMILLIGVFVHETIMLIGFPVTIFLALYKYIQENDMLNKKKLISDFIMKSIVLIVVPVIAFIVLVVVQELSSVSSQHSSITAYLKSFNFPDVSVQKIEAAFFTSFSDFVKNESRYFPGRVFSLRYLLIIGVPLALMLNYAWENIKGSMHSALLFVLILISSLVPLLMHLIAYDMARIWTYPLISLFMIIWGITEIGPNNKDNLIFENSSLIAVIACLMIEYFMRIDLMDYKVENITNIFRLSFYGPATIIVFMILCRKMFPRKAKTEIQMIPYIENKV